MKVSVTGISDFQPEAPLEKAWYQVCVVGAELAQTRKGRDQLILDLAVEDGPAQSDDSDPVGRQIRDYVLLSTDGMQDIGAKLTMQKLKNTLESFEISLDNDDFDSDDFLDKSALALIKVKPDNDGIPRANVAQYKAV